MASAYTLTARLRTLEKRVECQRSSLPHRAIICRANNSKSFRALFQSAAVTADGLFCAVKQSGRYCSNSIGRAHV